MRPNFLAVAAVIVVGPVLGFELHFAADDGMVALRVVTCNADQSRLRADRLAEQPEFYNTLTNTCTTNITRHLAELTGEPLPLDLRVILPGYADGLALELGLIDAEGSLDVLRGRFRINGRSAFGADGPDWSRQIRRAP